MRDAGDWRPRLAQLLPFGSHELRGGNKKRALLELLHPLGAHPRIGDFQVFDGKLRTKVVQIDVANLPFVEKLLQSVGVLTPIVVGVDEVQIPVSGTAQ